MSSRRNGAFWLIVILMVAGAAGFFVWKRFLQEHTAQFAVQGTDCKGTVTVEESAYRDSQVLFKRAHQLDGAGGRVSWSSGELADRAGTQYSVLVRGDCRVLACRVLLDGESGGAKETDSGQVSCTAMVGN
jgi:hypothetical protein